MYKNQLAIINYKAEQGEAQIRQEPREGCALSPSLFNIYGQQAINGFRQLRNTGITIRGETIETIRYADDTLLAETKEEPTEVLKDISQIFQNNYNIKIEEYYRRR